MVKVAVPNVSPDEVIEYLRKDQITISDDERSHLEMLIEFVRTGMASRDHRENQKLAKRVSELHGEVERFYPDSYKRIDIQLAITDILKR